MGFNLDYELTLVYEKWLMYHYPDEVTCKDRLIKMVERQYHIDEFIDACKKELGAE